MLVARARESRFATGKRQRDRSPAPTRAGPARGWGDASQSECTCVHLRALACVRVSTARARACLPSLALPATTLAGQAAARKAVRLMPRLMGAGRPSILSGKTAGRPAPGERRSDSGGPEVVLEMGVVGIAVRLQENERRWRR